MEQTVSRTGLTKAERNIVRLVAAIQFINILDFMMVLPLGPDFARALDIPNNRIGIIGGAYTAASFVSGLLGSLYLDRLDRRRALGLAMVGLVSATALGGLSLGFHTLVMARILAGLFGGPAASLALAIVADHVAVERRGRAMGIVSGSFAAASVLGVPIGLKLAEWGGAENGWRAPFFAVSGLGFLTIFFALRVMKPQRDHLTGLAAFDLKTRLANLQEIARRRTTMLGFAATYLSLFGNFLLIPNMSAYFQFNLGYPRADLSLLYLCGGFTSFFGMRYAGRLIDRHGAYRISLAAAGGLLTIYYLLFYDYHPFFPVLFLFTLFMTINSARFIIVNTTTSKIPDPHERAGFMSLMTAVQNLGISMAAFASSLILVQGDGGALEHMPRLTIIAIVIAATIPFLIGMLEKRLYRKPKSVIIESALDVTTLD